MQRYGGISRYFANLNNGLNKQPGFSSSISILYSENEYIKDLNFPLNNALGHRLFSGHNSRIYRWNRRYTNILLKTSKYDIFHPTYYDPYFLGRIKCPFVLTVHDMVHELLPQIFLDAEEVASRKKTLITAANKIIAISEHTKRDITRFYPEAESKISVVHHGYCKTNYGTSALILPEKYVLFVGERWHYKNFLKSIAAISNLFLKDKHLMLVCAGGGPFDKKETALFDELDISAQCMQMNANDAELGQLYREARLFFFPSLQEGFGLPILEAFAADCPVVCSNTASLPEVAGDAAYYFDPEDGPGMINTVEKVLYDSELQVKLKTAGQKRLRSFTFDTCLKNTISVYRSLF